MAKSVPVDTNGSTDQASEPTYMTPVQAMEYLGIGKQAFRKALANPKYAHIFSEANGNMRVQRFAGYPDIVQVSAPALDQYRSEAASAHQGNRAARKGARVERIRVSDEQRDQVLSALAAFGIGFEEKKSRAKRSTNTPTTVPTLDHELVETDLIEA